LIRATCALTFLVVGIYATYAVLISFPGATEQRFAAQFGELNCSVWPAIFFFLSESIDSIIKVKFQNFNQLGGKARNQQGTHHDIDIITTMLSMK
jgi:hypothetical protein